MGEVALQPSHELNLKTLNSSRKSQQVFGQGVVAAEQSEVRNRLEEVRAAPCVLLDRKLFDVISTRSGFHQLLAEGR